MGERRRQAALQQHGLTTRDSARRSARTTLTTPRVRRSSSQASHVSRRRPCASSATGRSPAAGRRAAGGAAGRRHDAVPGVKNATSCRLRSSDTTGRRARARPGRGSARSPCGRGRRGTAPSSAGATRPRRDRWWARRGPARVPAQQGAGDREPLALAAGQGPPALADAGVVALRQPLDEGVGIGRAGAARISVRLAAGSRTRGCRGRSRRASAAPGARGSPPRGRTSPCGRRRRARRSSPSRSRRASCAASSRATVDLPDPLGADEGDRLARRHVQGHVRQRRRARAVVGEGDRRAGRPRPGPWGSGGHRGGRRRPARRGARRSAPRRRWRRTGRARGRPASRTGPKHCISRVRNASSPPRVSRSVASDHTPRVDDERGRRPARPGRRAGGRGRGSGSRRARRRRWRGCGGRTTPTAWSSRP